MKFFSENKINYDNNAVEVGRYETAKKNGNCIWITDNYGNEICLDLSHEFKVIYKKVGNKITEAKGY